MGGFLRVIWYGVYKWQESVSVMSYGEERAERLGWDQLGYLTMYTMYNMNGVLV